ncbi:MAG: hypothetical protein MRJ96_14595 [Nitrospirales bacterium]|nr:hypothetical protein [Nitrospira sp.]MDR4502670.1 hypothetical protein [Nitrospirales bacterium]
MTKLLMKQYASFNLSSLTIVNGLGKIKYWFTKISCGLLDQGFFVLSNVLLNVFLLRWLSPSDYASFTIAFAVFLLIAGFYNSLILEPMSVLGPSHYGSHLPEYVFVLLRLHVTLTLTLSSILGFSALAFFIVGSQLASTLLWLAATTPFILCVWFTRRVGYLFLMPVWSLIASSVYCVTLLTGVLGLFLHTTIIPGAVLLTMGCASITASCIVGVLIFNTYATQLNHAPHLRPQAVWTRHIEYGRWTIGSTIALWIGANAYIPVIALFLGNPQVAGFRAIQSLISPMNQCLATFSHVLLPYISRRCSEIGRKEVKEGARDLFLLNFCVASLFLLLLSNYGSYILPLLSGQSFYVEYLWLLPYFILTGFLGIFVQSSVVLLMAIQRPDLIFLGRSTGALVSLICSLLLGWHYGMAGIAMSMTIGSIAEGIVLYLVKHHEPQSFRPVLWDNVTSYFNRFTILIKPKMLLAAMVCRSWP